MFTGIVETAVPVRSYRPAGSGARLVLAAPQDDLGEAWRVTRGQSIAVAGACLTVAELLGPGSQDPVPDGEPGADMAFDLSAETLKRTWFARCGDAPGHRRLNLERALRLGGRLDGHMVSGHVDGQGKVVALEEAGDGGREITFQAPPELERFLVDKGSVTIDGVSLTVVEPREGRFRVALIPVTLQVTSLGNLAVGDPVHLEADMIGKWVDRLLVRE